MKKTTYEFTCDICKRPSDTGYGNGYTSGHIDITYGVVAYTGEAGGGTARYDDVCPECTKQVIEFINQLKSCREKVKDEPIPIDPTFPHGVPEGGILVWAWNCDEEEKKVLGLLDDWLKPETSWCIDENCPHDCDSCEYRHYSLRNFVDDFMHIRFVTRSEVENMLGHPVLE